jgi:hypothetical protein
MFSNSTHQVMKVKSMTLQKSVAHKHISTNQNNHIDSSSAPVKSTLILTASPKPAWLNAPLPQFYDLDMATAMVNEGYYPSLDKAFIDVPETRKIELREKSDQYYKSCRSVNFWQNAPLPSPKDKI